MTTDVHRLQQAFDAAELQADTDTLHALLTVDFKSIGEQGHVLDKTQWIGKFADFAYASLESSDVEVTCYDGAAVVRCIQRSRSTWRGQEMALTVRLSQTWVRQHDRWKLAGVHYSPLRQT